MAIERDPNAPRGIGRERFNQILRQRAPERLQDGKQMLYEHALRCFCSLCGALLNWECPEDISYTETECCGLLYRLKPWTVRVVIEDVSSRPVLPKMPGSDYSDPETDLSSQLVGELRTIETVICRPLTASQKALGKPKEPTVAPGEPTVQVSKKKLPRLKKERRCSLCHEPGHDKRSCPGLVRVP